MRNRLACALLLLLLASRTQARDPFFLPEANRCAAVAAADSGWRLQGVIGRIAHFDAWLISPQGLRLRRQQGDSLPGTTWYVANIDAVSITLKMAENCQPPLRLTLQGRQNVYQDTRAVAGVNRPAGSGRTPSDSGI